MFLYHSGEWLLKALIPAIDAEIASPIRPAMRDTSGVQLFLMRGFTVKPG